VVVLLLIISPVSLKPYVGESRNIANFIQFVDGMGLAALPTYNNKHSYHFVMEVPKNAGQYNIKALFCEEQFASIMFKIETTLF
jgi:hypothetical protein